MKKTMLLLMGVFCTVFAQAQGNLEILNISPCAVRVTPGGVEPTTGLAVFFPTTLLPGSMVTPLLLTPTSVLTTPPIGAPAGSGTLGYLTSPWEWYYVYATTPTFVPGYGEQGGTVGDATVRSGALLLNNMWLHSSCPVGPTTINMSWAPSPGGGIPVRVTIF